MPLELNSFKVAFQEKKEFDYPWHYHPEFELTYILSSHGVRYVGNSIASFADDDLVLAGPNLPHCWKNAGEQELPASAIVIQWKEDFLGKEWFQHQEFAAIRKLLELSKKGIKFNKEVACHLKESFFELLELPPFEKLIRLLQILQQLAQTEQYHVLCEQGFLHNLNHKENERIDVVHQYVKNNYAKKITLAEIAELVSMNEVYFSRFFSKIMQKSFFVFLNEYRITIACQLLIDTDLQVAEICYLSGYESLPFFYRQFKKFKGHTPLAYKAQYQKIFPKT
ncbi:AraC family transcriptional regulator [Flammeovirgaceae bacterium 311]|nr:AraC family transcriptional regulator [Flammeovirgaceae bacterium 311]